MSLKPILAKFEVGERKKFLEISSFKELLTEKEERELNQGKLELNLTIHRYLLYLDF
jgi:hypothetical protein